MPTEPSLKRAVAFVDGQNLFHAVKKAFGYTYPNYDAQRLAQEICSAKGWQLTEVRFYTGVPNAQDKPLWHGFWTNKLAAMGRAGVVVYSRSLVYRNKSIRLPNGSTHSFLDSEEKGIDVRLALDALHLAHQDAFDVALIFSQDQDLSELAVVIRTVAQVRNRWIKIASAYPTSPACPNQRGINWTDWCPIDRSTYDGCIDPRDYRPKQP